MTKDQKARARGWAAWCLFRERPLLNTEEIQGWEQAATESKHNGRNPRIGDIAVDVGYEEDPSEWGRGHIIKFLDAIDYRR